MVVVHAFVASGLRHVPHIALARLVAQPLEHLVGHRVCLVRDVRERRQEALCSYLADPGDLPHEHGSQVVSEDRIGLEARAAHAFFLARSDSQPSRAPWAAITASRTTTAAWKAWCWSNRIARAPAHA